MRVLLNVVWPLLSGLWLALAYVLAGILMCLLIITIPFGIQAFKLAGFALWPFGRSLVPRRDAGSASVVGNVLWFVLAGLWIAIVHVVSAVALALTIIGLPLAAGNLKFAIAALFPFGREVVDNDDLHRAAPAGARPVTF